MSPSSASAAPYNETIQLSPTAPSDDTSMYDATVSPAAYELAGDCPTCESGARCDGCCPELLSPRRDELLCDGGDRNAPAGVRVDGTFAGLEPTDTVGAYETVDGKTVVEPSNRVCIYAPRFAAVRRVTNIATYQDAILVDGVLTDASLAGIGELAQPTTTLQRIDPSAHRGTNPSSLLRGRQQGGEVGNEDALAQTIGKLLPYASLEVVRAGVFSSRQNALLAEGTLAAVTWSHDLGVQVTIDGRRAQASVGDQQLSIVYRVNEPDSPKLRIVKIASKHSALPGETVDFTLRYDNVGDQTMKNVTIVDNLTTRLVFEDGSDKSSRDARFSATANDVGSFQLRWDLTEPLPAGDGGVLTFRCRVQ